MLISIPPKYAVVQVVGFIEGKSAIHIARTREAIAGKFHRQYLVHVEGRPDKICREADLR